MKYVIQIDPNKPINPLAIRKHLIERMADAEWGKKPTPKWKTVKVEIQEGQLPFGAKRKWSIIRTFKQFIP